MMLVAFQERLGVGYRAVGSERWKANMLFDFAVSCSCWKIAQNNQNKNWNFLNLWRNFEI